MSDALLLEVLENQAHMMSALARAPETPIAVSQALEIRMAATFRLIAVYRGEDQPITKSPRKAE